MKNSILIVKVDKAIAYPFKELRNKLMLESLKELDEFFLSTIYLIAKTKKVTFEFNENYIIDKINPDHQHR